jgi:hypothetical protein
VAHAVNILMANVQAAEKTTMQNGVKYVFAVKKMIITLVLHVKSIRTIAKSSITSSVNCSL